MPCSVWRVNDVFSFVADSFVSDSQVLVSTNPLPVMHAAKGAPRAVNHSYVCVCIRIYSQFSAVSWADGLRLRQVDKSGKTLPEAIARGEMLTDRRLDTLVLRGIKKHGLNYKKMKFLGLLELRKLLCIPEEQVRCPCIAHAPLYSALRIFVASIKHGHSSRHTSKHPLPLR